MNQSIELEMISSKSFKSNTCDVLLVKQTTLLIT